MPQSRQKLSVGQLRVGIFVFAGLLILGFMIINSSGDFNPFEKKMRLKARFVSADGLHKAAEVQLAGVTVGGSLVGGGPLTKAKRRNRFLRSVPPDRNFVSVGGRSSMAGYVDA